MTSNTTNTKMIYRRLGKTGLKVSALSFGGWLTWGGQVDQDVCNKCIKAALDHGINFFDNAEVYANGKSEEAFGKAFKDLGVKRSDLVISTKIFWGGKGPNDNGLSRKHIIEGLNASLERLQLDYVDIVFAHRPDPETPIEETVRAFNHVIQQGKAFYWGTSEWSAQQIMAAHAVAERLGLEGPVADQCQYNMFHRERMEKEYEFLFRDYGMGTTTWSPLASGVLTGKYLDGISEDSRAGNPKVEFGKHIRARLESDEGREQAEKIRKLKPIADKLGCSLAQLALAWCLKHPNASTVITGASKVEQMHENMKALDLVDKLDEGVMKEIDEVLANNPGKNPRYY
ncbi:uncharacterized protein VTP21DRAFT_692 [Calcarisporiella thermophila]|uniref:uncharacterized protein n=1 Tax=Calcarisporiella thermophila TaxID=911321 RepID=UPI0037424E03